MTKRELEDGYGMEKNGAHGEWYIQILNLENYWFEKGEPVDNEVTKTFATVTYDYFTRMAKQALKNASLKVWQNNILICYFIKKYYIRITMVFITIVFLYRIVFKMGLVPRLFFRFLL